MSNKQMYMTSSLSRQYQSVRTDVANSRIMFRADIVNSCIICRTDIANSLNNHLLSQSELIQQFHKEYESARREEMTV